MDANVKSHHVQQNWSKISTRLSRVRLVASTCAMTAQVTTQISLSCTLVQITEGITFSVVVTEFRSGTPIVSEFLKFTNIIQKSSGVSAIISIKSDSGTK
jgi:hypothetical protein